MKKYMIGAVLFILVFIGSALTFNFIGNLEYETKSVEVVESTLDKAYISYDGQKYNPMEVYSTKLLTGLRRNSIIPVDESKTVNVIIPDSISKGHTAKYELRDMQGSNLIEEGDMTLVSDDASSNEYSVSLRMDMTSDREYSLVFVLADETEGKKEPENYYYYTRVKRCGMTRLNDLTAYAEAFSNTILSENQLTAPMEETELGGYYGKDAQGTYSVSSETDATLDPLIVTDSFSGKDDKYHTYGHTVLSSDYDTVIMSGVAMARISEVIPNIREVSDNSASVQLSARYVNRVGEKARYFTVNEFYTLEYSGSLDTYNLVDYERTIEEAFNKDDVISGSGRLRLGFVADEEPEYAASKDSKKVAFVMDNALWYYSSSDNYYAKLYGQSDVTTMSDTDYGIKIITISDDQIDFIVYGRIPLGSHMAHNGIVLYSYMMEGNSIKEIDFIETELPYDALKQQAGRYCYYDRKGHNFYTLFSDKLLKIDVLTNEMDELISELPFYDMYVSKDKTVLAYPNTKNLEDVDSITILSLRDGIKRVEEVPGEKLSILGFMGNDLVYGAAKPEDVLLGADNVPRFVFDKIIIVDKQGNVKKNYDKESIYITGLSFDSDNLYLNRIIKQGTTGETTTIGDDYITSNPVAASGDIHTAIHTDDIGLSGLYLDFPDTVYVGRNPDEIITRLARGDKPKKTQISGEISGDVYYVFTGSGLKDMTLSAGKAISAVTEGGGFVVDSAGNVIYREKEAKAFFTVAGTFDYSEAGEGASLKETFYRCEYMELLQAGINADYNDVEGREDWNNLIDELSGGTVRGLNLSGADLDVAIGFLSDGAAFITKLEDRYVLVISYNADYIRYYDPIAGEEVRVGRRGFRDTVRKSGNEIYTWMK